MDTTRQPDMFGQENGRGTPFSRKGSSFRPSSSSPPPSPESSPGLVSFVGAGPGDPELLTLKAARRIARAGLIVYAGSLVPEAMLEGAAGRRVDSSGLTLGETHALMVETARSGAPVVRLHTGDPALYGAVAEQTRLLDRDGVPWEVVPGVTSASAAAAAFGVSFTAPEATQTLILTRLAGRTPTPATERLRDLARHGASMAVYLSAGDPAGVAEELLSGGLSPEVAVAVAYRVGWPDERLMWSTVGGLAGDMAGAGMTRQTLFLVLPGLGAETRSKLYDPDFSHGFRNTGGA